MYKNKYMTIFKYPKIEFIWQLGGIQDNVVYRTVYTNQ